MSTNRVLGERPEDIISEMHGFPVEGGADEGPLSRALLRAEAELLVADAAAMAFGTYVERTPGERRQDARDLVMQRLSPHLQAAS